eukprot:8296270-Lingulodinium_polyedra.AAC.1
MPYPTMSARVHIHVYIYASCYYHLPVVVIQVQLRVAGICARPSMATRMRAGCPCLLMPV